MTVLMFPGIVRRFIAVGLLVLLLALLVLATVSPLWQNYRAMQVDIADRAAELRHMLDTVANAEYLSRQHNELQVQGGLSRHLIKGASIPLAAAALQKRIEVAAHRHNGQLTSTEVLHTTNEHGLTQVGIHARMILDTPSLQQLLHELESELPLLVIDNMVVTSPGGMQDSSVPIKLDVDLMVIGWMRSPSEDI